MSYQKQYVGGYGMIVVYAETYKTDWVQLRGEDVIRCDHEAKETGYGVWIIESPNKRTPSSWLGMYSSSHVARQDDWIPDPELWIADPRTRVVEYEKDVS